MSGRNFHKWSWFREPGYFAGGLYGRPWSLTLQWSSGAYLNLDFSAPWIGDCGVSWNSERWLNHPIYGRARFGERRLMVVTRHSWAAIDASEAENGRRSA